jgi:flagellar biosynthesis/type III secretory pathway M-ring protein FliF/YscJ
LCLFEVIEFPSWHKHDVLDWVYQSAVALVALAGLIAAIAVLAARLRRRAVAEAAPPGN